MLVGLFLVIAVLSIVINRWKSRRILKLSRQLQNKFKAYPVVGHGYAFSGSDVDRMKAFIEFGLEAIKNNGVTSLWLGYDYFTVIADAVIADTVMKSCLEKSHLADVFQHLLGNGSIFAPETALGIKVNAQTQPDQPFLAAFDEYCELIATRMCQPWLRIDALYKLLPDSKKLKKDEKLICDYVDKVVKSKLAKQKDISSDENVNKSAYKNFLDLIIESSGNSRFTDVELREETLVIVLAGTDTSAVAASFTSAMLSRHMDVQNKVYEELCEVFGDSSRPVSYADLPKLKYLEAVIKETMRLYTPVPIIGRKLDKDIALPSGLTLVKETDAIINIWALHRNPRYWGKDAEEFRPERFLEGPLEHPAAFMPFSHGARNCLGYKYAMMAMKTALATVLRRYRFLPADPSATEADLRKPLQVKFDIMMRNVDNYMVRIESRSKSSVHTNNTLVEI